MGDSSPSFSTIKKWAAEFKRGPTSLEDNPREGRPKTATPEITEQVHNMVLDDRQMKVCKISETIGISKERVGYILHELDMKKLCARWLQCLEHFIKNKTDFVCEFITMDETSIHHYTPES